MTPQDPVKIVIFSDDVSFTARCALFQEMFLFGRCLFILYKVTLDHSQRDTQVIESHTESYSVTQCHTVAQSHRVTQCHTESH